MSEQPYRLVRDALGFYSQVPVLPPEETPVVVEPAPPTAEVAASPPAELPPRRRGRKKANINADFEVNV